nr:hypothetical protein [Methanolacinia paynteri]
MEIPISPKCGISAGLYAKIRLYMRVPGISTQRKSVALMILPPNLCARYIPANTASPNIRVYKLPELPSEEMNIGVITGISVNEINKRTTVITLYVKSLLM